MLEPMIRATRQEPTKAPADGKRRGVAPRHAGAKPKAIDLFCGCGGLSVGLKAAGFSVVAAVDSDPLACSTYRKNHRTRLIGQDIRTVDPAELMAKLGLSEGELGLLAGCPPCQGFSTLRTLNGGKEVDEPMNDLVFEFSRFIAVFKPQTVM